MGFPGIFQLTHEINNAFYVSTLLRKKGQKTQILTAGAYIAKANARSRPL